MSEFTPTTEDIEAGFARYCDLTDQASEARAKTAFQKWLRSVQAEAWRNGYYTGKRDYAGSITGGIPISTPNPYQENHQ